MEMDKRIKGIVFTKMNTKEAEKHIGEKGFFLYDECDLDNLDLHPNVKTGVLKEVWQTSFKPYMDDEGWRHSVFVSEESVVDRPCSNEIYETKSENTIKYLTEQVDEEWWNDTEFYKTSAGLLELKYNSCNRVMLEKRGDEVHVWCNYTVRDWRKFMVRMETER